MCRGQDPTTLFANDKATCVLQPHRHTVPMPAARDRVTSRSHELTRFVRVHILITRRPRGGEERKKDEVERKHKTPVQANENKRMLPRMQLLTSRDGQK